jgi:hypothetical protein
MKPLKVECDQIWATHLNNDQTHLDGFKPIEVLL